MLVSEYDSDLDVSVKLAPSCTKDMVKKPRALHAVANKED